MPDAILLATGFITAALAALLVPLVLRRTSLLMAAAFVLLGVVRVEPAATDVLLALALISGLVTGRLLLQRVPPSVLLLLGLFAAINVYAVANAVDRVSSVRYVLITIFLLAVAALMPMYVSGPREARLLVRCYLVGAVPLALLAVLALFVDFPFGEHLLGYRGTRAKALFKDPNVFGPALVPAAMILIDEILRPRLLTSPRSVKLVMLAVTLSGVLFSYSRAAWGNAAVALLVLLLVQLLRRADGGKRLLMGLVLMLALGAGSVVLVSSTSSGDFISERAQLQTYDTDRFGAQDRGLELAAAHPLTGVGPGQFELLAPISAHSLYVRVLTETGLAGLAALGGVLALTSGLAVHHVLRGQDSQGIGSGPLLATWCGLLVNSAVVDTLHWRHLWIVAGLVYVAEAGGRSSAGAAHQARSAALLRR